MVRSASSISAWVCVLDYALSCQIGQSPWAIHIQHNTSQNDSWFKTSALCLHLITPHSNRHMWTQPLSENSCRFFVKWKKNVQNHRRGLFFFSSHFHQRTMCLVPAGAGLLNDTLCCVSNTHNTYGVVFFRYDAVQCYCLQNECELMPRMRFWQSYNKSYWHRFLNELWRRKKKLFLSSRANSLYHVFSIFFSLSF